MRCRICDSNDLTEILDLGEQPWGNHFLDKRDLGSEPRYPLVLMYCNQCCLAQLNHTVAKETMFSDHTYVSGTTDTLRKHFRNTAERVDHTFFSDRSSKSVLDLGSNDGTQLQQYRNLGYDCLGVESCERVAKHAIDAGIDTVVDFFNEECATRINRQFDVISASGVFFHLEELHSFTRGIKRCLKGDGVFAVQFLYMKSIMENLAFDQIYHEHLLYYTLQTVQELLQRHELEAFDAYFSSIHGGSIVLYAGHPGVRPKSKNLSTLAAEEQDARTNEIQTYFEFADRVQQLKQQTIEFLCNQKAAGKRVFGFGAPVKGNTFLNFCEIDSRQLDYLVEKNPLRKGLYSPGMHIPIVLEDELEAPPDVYFVLAWNFRKEILSKNRDLIDNGVEFYFPIEPDLP